MKVPGFYQDACEQCGEPCLEEVLRVQHETETEVTESIFCSAKCLHEYYGVAPRTELDRRFKQEANFIYKLVCPACKSRFQRLVASGVLDE